METWEKRPLWQLVAWRARLLYVYSEIHKVQKFRKTRRVRIRGRGQKRH